MADVTEATGLLQVLAGLFGPGGAVLAITNAVSLWWLKHTHSEHKEERAALMSSLKDSEAKRREDGIAQFAKIDTFIDKLGEAYQEVAKTLTELRISLAEKGLHRDI